MITGEMIPETLPGIGMGGDVDRAIGYMSDYIFFSQSGVEKLVDSGLIPARSDLESLFSKGLTLAIKDDIPLDDIVREASVLVFDRLEEAYSQQQGIGEALELPEKLQGFLDDLSSYSKQMYKLPGEHKRKVIKLGRLVTS